MSQSIRSPQSKSDLVTLLEDYYDLTPRHIRRLSSPPSPLEMLRIIQDGRPVVIEGFDPQKRDRGQTSTVSHKPDWDDPDTLVTAMGKAPVSIAVTPNGLADSIQHDPITCQDYFVQPHTEKMTMTSFLDRLLDQADQEVHYLQSQNGNIYRARPAGGSEQCDEHASANSEDEEQPELARLQEVFEKDVGFMTEALGRSPDAVNLWVGNSKSVTSLHKDPATFEIERYLNIYTLLSGTKVFTVLPPLEGYLLDQSFYPTATYARPSSSSSNPGRLPLHIRPDDLPYRVPWTRTDPLNLPPDSPVRPIRLVVGKGETLYLPAGWWHHVQQVEGPGGVCVAVNYWYDQTIDPEKYALERFVWRQLGRRDIVDGPGGDEEDV